MRTTLKRGLGQSSSFNGDGNGVLPPGAVEPMRRYRQPARSPRSRTRLAMQILGWIALGLLVVAAGLAGGLYLYAHETLNALAPHTRAAKLATRDLNPVASPTQPATGLLIGYDQRMGADADTAAGSRSDTLMLVRADPTNDTLSLLSFPRDLVVPIYCNGSSVPVASDRINSAWARCGERGTLDTVEHLTNIPVNYLITADFHGFKLLVNKLNGVYLDVDHRYLNTVGGPGGYAKIDLEPGYQKLDGQQALDFVRFRHTDSDLYRLARQQLFIEALKDRLATGVSILDIPKLIGAVKGSIEIGTGGCSTCAPSLSEVESYTGLAYHLRPGHLFRNTIENVTDCGYLNAQICASAAAIQAAVNSFMHPDVTLPTRTEASALGIKPKAPKQRPPKPAQISTLVLNGTTIAGLARDTSYKLALAGYHTVQLPSTILADAPSQSYYTTTVYYDAVQAHAKQAARELKLAFGANTILAPLSPELSGFARRAGNPLTVVVVGSSFNGDLADPATSIQPTPPPAPPAVQSGTELLRSPLESVRAQVPFRLMLPSQIAAGSTLAALDPVRVFKPAPDRKEVALTFVTPAGNVYWQVIETNLANPPVLRHPTGTLRLSGGRKLLLYTNGGHVNLAVIRTGETTYWVVNTLLSSLSNETMIAIAKGLIPLTG